MSRTSHLRTALAGILILSGCAESTLPTQERVPVRWQLVERPYRRFSPLDVAGGGRVDLDATVIAFEPLYPEDLEVAATSAPSQLSVEIVELLPRQEAGPGQPISATVRVVNAAAGSRYRLRIAAVDPRVCILGERERTVKGLQTATFRFTSPQPGNRGFVVEVERLD